MQHSLCCGTEKDELIINASVRECSQCDVFFGDAVSYARHMEKVHLTVPCCVCTLCRNLYVSSVALDFHLVNCHGGLELAKRDYGGEIQITYLISFLRSRTGSRSRLVVVCINFHLECFLCH